MPPAPLVEFSLEPLRWPRRRLIVARIAPRAGHAGAAAAAGMLAFLWSIGMELR